jgi:hypothetical protein
MGGSPAWGFGEGLTTSHSKKPDCYKMLHRALDLGPVAGSCEQGNEPLGSIKGRELLDKLGAHQLLTKDSAP